MIIMSKSFKEDCRILMKDLRKSYSLSNAEILLWIYINIYFYRGINKTSTFYGKEIFLQCLKNNVNFYLYYSKYKIIDEKEYKHLYHRIFEKYFFYKEIRITVDEMEEIYEEFIQGEERVKTGSYYTPKWIVEYMTFKSITSYIDMRINDKNNILEDYLLDKTNSLPMDYILKAIEILEKLKIADIACGGGIFLRQGLRVIYDLTKKLYQLIGRRFTSETILEIILENNLYGVDIQYDTIGICKVLILLEVQSLCKTFIKGSNLKIFHGDALIMDFSKFGVLTESFDVIIGNPPYIGERGNKLLFDAIKESEFGAKYYERNMDYFYFFFYKSYELLKEKGFLCYITTNYFVTADGAKNLRCFLKKNYNFKEIINFNTLNIFVDAKGQHNMIFLIEKTLMKAPVSLINFRNKRMNIEGLYEKLLLEKHSVPEIEITKIPQEKLYDNKGQISIQSQGEEREVLDKIEEIGNFIMGDLCFVNQGIVTGADKLTASWGKRLNMEKEIGKGIFVLTEKELQELNFDDGFKKSYVKTFYKNSHIKKYYTLKNQGLYLLYINDDNLSQVDEYPNLYKHLLKFKEILQQRREVKRDVRSWYALQWPRDRKIFEGEKIVTPQRSLQNTFAYTKKPFYASADVYYITPRNQEISLLYILGILNSALIHFWLYYRGKRKGEQLELYATPLKSIPIYYSYSSKKIEEIEGLVKYMMEHVDNEKIAKETQNKLDKIIFKLYQLKSREKKMIMGFIKSRN